MIRAAASGALLAMLGLALAGSPGRAQTANNQVLPGSKSGQPIDIDAGALDYFDKEQKLVYKGHVVAVQGGSRLKASTLVIYLLPKEEGETSGPTSNTEVRRMEAAGPVTLSSKDQVGTGDSGTYEKSDNKVTLIGNVTLTQGPNVTKGDRLVYDLTTKQAVVTGANVRSMFIPKNGGTTASTGDKAVATAPTASSAKPTKPPAKSERLARDPH